MNNEKQHIEFLDLIGKYLANEANSEEINILEEWVLKDPANKKTFMELKQTWMLSNADTVDKQINLNEEWAQFNSAIIDEEEYADFLLSESSSFNYNKFLKVAAIIVVFLTAGYFLFYLVSNPSTEQLVAGNSVVPATLPDGTEVTLNHNSILKYPKIFASNVRAVRLQGDAYFDVAHDLSKPFVIQTKNIQIEVLGTSFYLNAKNEQPTVEVFVETGKVAIIGNKKEKLFLTAGEKGTFEKSSGQLTKAENNDLNFISWKTRKLIFDNESLINVINIINQTYHSNITIDNPDIYHCMLTATFEEQPLEIILEVLQEIFDLIVEREENGKILISGNGCK
jgi:ferric-dicitrate binding protein FerR (iron transport regulator)